MWFNFNYGIGFYIRSCMFFVTGYAATYLYFKVSRPRVEYKGYAKFLGNTSRRGNNINHCGLHLANRQACSESCRYAFLTWLISCVDGAKSRLDVCIYFLSLDVFVDALVRARKRGVKVRVILHISEDSSELGDAFLKLRRAYVPTRSMQTPVSQLMHLKMVLVDHEYVMWGSINLTNSAIQFNSEEVAVLYNPSLVTACARYIQGIWDDVNEMNDFFQKMRDLSQESLKAKATIKCKNNKAWEEKAW